MGELLLTMREARESLEIKDELCKRAACDLGNGKERVGRKRFVIQSSREGAEKWQRFSLVNSKEN